MAGDSTIIQVLMTFVNAIQVMKFLVNAMLMIKVLKIAKLMMATVLVTVKLDDINSDFGVNVKNGEIISTDTRINGNRCRC